MRTLCLLSAIGLICLAPGAARAQTPEDEIINNSALVMREIMEIPGRGIPAALLNQAHGLVIIPGMLKGGFMVGVKHGRGVVLSRDDSGAWKAPVFVTATGGSFGWQVGLQSTDVILVVRNRRGVESMMRGKFTIGADASVAAGPIGREAAAATDLNLKAEILSYSRSRGLFAGVAIDGAIIHPDNRATSAYYQPPGALPASALKLIEVVASYTKTAAPVIMQSSPTAVPAPAGDRESLRRQLVESSKRLQVELDAQWRQYLALPQDVYVEGKNVPPDLLESFVNRYNTVAKDKQYEALTTRPEFQEMHTLLNRYYSSLTPANTEIPLPPPPPPQR